MGAARSGSAAEEYVATSRPTTSSASAVPREGASTAQTVRAALSKRV
jgi:hypothetical protein